MFRKLSITVGAIAGLSLGVYFISDITKKDIVAANAFARLAEAEPLSAGDIVVVPERGKMSRLCNARVAPEHLMAEEKSGRYFNRAHNIVATAARAAHAVGLISETRASAMIDRSELRFVGETSALNGGTYTYMNPDECQCAIVRSLARGERVCNVSASLIETGEVTQEQGGQSIIRPTKRSLAVTLKRHVIFMPPEVYAQCGVEYTEAARIAEQKLCTDGARLPLDVTLRDRLNLIDSTGLEKLVHASAE